MLRESRGEHGYLIRRFFQHFKEMFVQAALTFFLFAGLFFVLLYSLVFWHSLSGTAAAAAFAFTLVLAFYIFSGFLFAFPLMARFKNSFWKTIHNAFLLSMTNLKLTAALLLIYAVLACMASSSVTPGRREMVPRISLYSLRLKASNSARALSISFRSALGGCRIDSQKMRASFSC